MNSATKMLRDMLLLLQFVVLISVAEAFSMNSYIHSEPDYFYNSIDITDQQGFSNYTNLDIKKALPDIVLTLTPFGSKIALLTWISTDNTIAGTYYVQRLDASGWTVLKQLPYNALLEYNDTISYPYCASTDITYQISFVSAIDSITSNQTSADLKDTNPPADVKNLNVDLVQIPNGEYQPRITWDKMTTDSIKNYHIQRYDNITTKWPEIDSVTSVFNTYEDQTALQPCDNSYRYVVQAYDMCGNHSGNQLYDVIAVHTIKLDAVYPDPCEKSAKLSWNSNHNMPAGITGFRIYRSDGGQAVKIDSVDSKATTYVDNFNFINGIQYIYFVTAYSDNSSYTSSSCKVFQQYNGTIQPDTVYITQVTVKDDSYIEIGCYFTPGSSVVQLVLERSDDNGTNFHAIDSLAVSLPKNLYSFDDINVDVHAQSYSYRLISVDECNNRKISINVSRSIYIKCTPKPDQSEIGWNTYEWWLRGIDRYDVFRTLDGNQETGEILTTVDLATISYSDLNSSFDQSKVPCYWVVANEKAGSSVIHNRISTSTSNTCCVIKDPILYMPNAFHPEGINKLFRPVPEPFYIDTQTFKMTIFSRWGQQIFETTDMTNGWNGMVNGQPSPAGMYSYILTYSSLQGKEFTKRGTVTLIR